MRAPPAASPSRREGSARGAPGPRSRLRPKDARRCYPERVSTASRGSLAASFLIAAPQLQDPNFRRSVVLVVQHDEEATVGLVVNRRSDVLAAKICRDLGIEWPGDPAARVGYGGPVQTNSGWVLFGDPAPPDRAQVTEVSAGLYVTSSADALRRLSTAEPPPDDLRFLLGYAGWAPGQLEHELALGAWLVVPADRQVIFGMDPATIWDNVLRALGIDPATLISTPGVH